MSKPTKAKKLGSKKLPAQRQPDATETGPGKNKRYLQPDVLKIVQNADGKPVTLEGLMEALDAKKHGIQHATAELAKKLPQFEVINRGRIWRWTDSDKVDPAPAPAPVMAGASPVAYEVIGQDQLGNDILRKVGEPQLYKVIPL